MSQDSNNNSEASIDTKNINNKNKNQCNTEAPHGDLNGASGVKSAGISLAAMEAKLEVLPEVELLTAELLNERKNQSDSSNSPKRVQKNRDPDKEKSPTVSADKSDVVGVSQKIQIAEINSEHIEYPEEYKEPEHAEESPISLEFGSRMKDNHRISGRGKIIRTVLLSAVVVVLGFIVFGTVRLVSVFNSVNYVKSGGSFGDTDMVVSQSAIAKYVSYSDETKNILLVGYDVDEYGVSRSDSMIILTLDHEHQKIKMTSLMRDMYVQIPGNGKHKLNAAFVYGGPELLLQTIYANFGLRIDNYVCVDYAAFVDVVDYIGGIQVDIEEIELEQFNKYVGGGKKNKIDEAGSYVLNGQQALSYCRIRKVGSDTARTARQREVLSKIMKRCSGMSLLKLEKLLRITAPAVTTNLSQVKIFRLAAEGLSSMDYDMQGMRIPVDGAWWDLDINGTSYVGIDLNANARYLYDFIYGDTEISDKLADNLTRIDTANEEREKASFEKNKASEN